MDQQKIIKEIEQRAWEERISISSLCHRARVHPSTFFRWKKSAENPEPVGANLKTINKLHAALDQIAAENRRKPLRQKAVAA